MDPIDLAEKMLVVKQGKGGKDWVVPLDAVGLCACGMKTGCLTDVSS